MKSKRERARGWKGNLQEVGVEVQKNREKGWEWWRLALGKHQQPWERRMAVPTSSHDAIYISAIHASQFQRRYQLVFGERNNRNCQIGQQSQDSATGTRRSGRCWLILTPEFPWAPNQTIIAVAFFFFPWILLYGAR